MKNKPNTISIGDIEIPTNRFAVAGTAALGIKNSGKSYGMKGVVEQLIEQGIPVTIFDAVGIWRYLKTPGDGPNAKGFPVVVAGGEDPDVPLTPHNAAEIVRAAMRQNVSVVIDLYSHELSKADWKRIVQSCFHTLLYENKKYGPRYVVLEEAAEYVPQANIRDGETFSAVEKLVRMGGNAYLGIALINPRSQEINKSVLDLCDNLVLMRQRGSSAIDAVEKWMDRVNPEVADTIVTKLPNMGQGECYVWAQDSDVPVFTKTKMIRSFHPNRDDPKSLITARKSIDTETFVSTLLSELPKVVEEKKQNDPTELKKTIAEQQRKIRELENKSSVPAKQLPPKVAHVPILSKSNEKVLNRQAQAFEALKKILEERMILFPDFKKQIDELCKLVRPVPPTGVKIITPQPARIAYQPLILRSPRQNRSSPLPPASLTSDGFRINTAQQRILDAIAWYESIGKPEPTNLMIGAIALMDATGGHFSNLVGPLSTNGLIVRMNGTMALTEEGRKIATVPTNVASIDDYHRMLYERVRKVRAAGGKTVEILKAIVANGDRQMKTEEIGAVVQMDHTGGHFSNMIGPLSTLGLITRGRGVVTPTEVLFPKGLV